MISLLNYVCKGCKNALGFSIFFYFYPHFNKTNIIKKLYLKYKIYLRNFNLIKLFKKIRISLIILKSIYFALYQGSNRVFLLRNKTFQKYLKILLNFIGIVILVQIKLYKKQESNSLLINFRFLSILLTKIIIQILKKNLFAFYYANNYSFSHLKDFLYSMNLIQQCIDYQAYSFIFKIFIEII